MKQKFTINQVKLFVSTMADDLENRVNDFLATKDVSKIVDIKISECDSGFTALVIYTTRIDAKYVIKDMSDNGVVEFCQSFEDAVDIVDAYTSDDKDRGFKRQYEIVQL